MIMVKHGMDVTLSVPLHDPVKRGTLRKLITDAGLSVEEFCELLLDNKLFLLKACVNDLCIIKKKVRIAGVICLVDAEGSSSVSWIMSHLVRKQIRSADLILLNKVDQIPESKKAAIWKE